MISEIFDLTPIYEDDEDILLFWQKKIFTCLFSILLISGIVPYLISCRYAFEQSEWYNVIMYTVIYLWAAGVTFFKKIPFPIRVWAGMFGFYFMGVHCLLTMGLMGSARLYLLCFSAFAAIFSGIKGGVASLVLTITTLVAFGYLNFNGVVSPDHLHGLPSPREWGVFIGTFSFLCILVTLSLAILINVLEISGREFKHLIKNTPDTIWTLNQQLIITFINSAVYPTFGFTQKEMMGHPITQFLPEQNLVHFKDQIKNKDDFNYETIVHHKDGTPIPVEITGSKISHFPDSHNMYQGIIRDMSQKKIREKEQHRLKEKLARAEKLKALGTLAGSVAHDLNNILSGIATYPEVLMMNKTLDPQTRQGLNLIKDSGRKASAVVSDLLTISRGVSVEMDIININTIIDRYLMAREYDTLKKTYPQVTLDVETEPELLNINGSYLHIEKTIMNLVLNAVEEVSNREGGIVLITTANEYINATMPGYDDMVPGEYVRLSVKDNGAGIDKKYREKIFDPFFTKKEMGKSGTGLGLTIVMNAVQDHKGGIKVSSNNKGTRFDLLFPAVRQDIPHKAVSTSLDALKGQGQRILVVDDLKAQQKIALGILEHLGYQAQAVDNGYAAVDVIRNHPADLIILDMIMTPSISGLETYQRIKKINPDQKAIIASGFSESEDVLMAQDLGAGSFIKKPYTLLDMGIAIKEELEK
ncbi:response regulator [Desulfobacula sp.]|uniref:hybrid sensor histidine kinase/response regulator n=1 Tax=Desulfobacula sp. TaxID=2593537 RepID=UPI00261C0A0D|nr:response regulator [Desulfobacula sp.]